MWIGWKPNTRMPHYEISIGNRFGKPIKLYRGFDWIGSDQPSVRLPFDCRFKSKEFFNLLARRRVDNAHHFVTVEKNPAQRISKRSEFHSVLFTRLVVVLFDNFS